MFVLLKAQKNFFWEQEYLGQQKFLGEALSSNAHPCGGGFFSGPDTSVGKSNSSVNRSCVRCGH